MRIRVSVVALTMLCAVSACADELEKPPTLPGVTPAPSASASPSASPAPREIAAPDAAGASAFGRYFYEQIEVGFATRDPGTVSSLSSPECVICKRYIDSITNLRDNGERVDDYTIAVIAADAPAISGDTARVTVVYNDSASTRKNAQGAVLDSEEGREKVAAELILRRSGQSWIVTEVRRG